MTHHRLGARALLLAAGLSLAAPSLALAGQPKMVHALDALRAARAKLAAAEPDKAGHREEALRLVDQALAQVQLGIEAGAGH